MRPVRIGTCGWSYKDWCGVFYPEGLQPPDYLAFYAEKFPIVEVDSTFYRPPTPRMIQTWRHKTPDHFGFSLKVPQVITHEKLLLECEPELEEFVRAIAPLEGKLVCCLLQFGYINRNVLPSLEAFLERLDPFLECWPPNVPLAVEVRNRSWFSRELADCLRRRGVIWALSDQEWVPPLLEVMQKMDTVTGPFGYVRLLGERTEVERHTKVFDRIVVDRSAELGADAEAIRMLSGRVPVVVFVNNHFAGHAPTTVQQLQKALR